MFALLEWMNEALLSLASILYETRHRCTAAFHRQPSIIKQSANNDDSALERRLRVTKGLCGVPMDLWKFPRARISIACCVRPTSQSRRECSLGLGEFFPRTALYSPLYCKPKRKKAHTSCTIMSRSWFLACDQVTFSNSVRPLPVLTTGGAVSTTLLICRQI